MKETVKELEKAPEPKKAATTSKKKIVLKKLDADTAKLLQSLNDKANKKSFGRKVRDTEIIGRALGLLQSEHLAELQQSTLSERDRLQIAHEDYQKAHGKLTLDQFIGKLLKGEISGSLN